MGTTIVENPCTPEFAIIVKDNYWPWPGWTSWRGRLGWVPGTTFWNTMGTLYGGYEGCIAWFWCKGIPSLTAVNIAWGNVNFGYTFEDCPNLVSVDVIAQTSESCPITLTNCPGVVSIRVSGSSTSDIVNNNWAAVQTMVFNDPYNSPCGISASRIAAIALLIPNCIDFEACGQGLTTINVSAFAGSADYLMINLYGNALTQAAVDGVLAACVAGGKSYGTLDLSGGTNAVPGTQGQADAATLVNTYGWTVNINS